MFHDLLRWHLETVEVAVKGLKNAHIECYAEEILIDKRANIKIRVRFLSGHLLELNESVVVVGKETKKLTHLGYRYHFQDETRTVLFQYDNTPHFPELDGLPDYKHVGDTIIGCQKPSIAEIVQEVKDLLRHVRDER